MTLKVWKPEDSRLSLGIVVDVLRRERVFAKLNFGEWTNVLSTTIESGTNIFIVDDNFIIYGILGWCAYNDAAFINYWCAKSSNANKFLIKTARSLFISYKSLYFNRFYTNKPPRPVRLSVNQFVSTYVESNKCR
jgi:hypothetical protein